MQVDPTPLKVYFWNFIWNFMQVARAIQKLCPRSHIHAYVRTMPGGQVPGMAIDPVMMIVSTQRLRDDDCAVVIMSRPNVCLFFEKVRNLSYLASVLVVQPY